MRERLHGECGPYHYIVEGGWKYLWFRSTGEEQLFDLVEDPCECQDRSTDSARLAPFRRHLAAHLASRDDVRFDPAACVPCANRPPRAIWK